MGAYWPLLPQAVLTGSLLGVLSCGLGLKLSARWLTFLGLALGCVALATIHLGEPITELLRFDGAAVAWQALFFAGALPLLGLMDSEGELSFALLLGALLGLSLMAVANHLFLLFMGLELMSLSIYMLLYASRADTRSLEAAMKYYFSGVTAAAIFLFGFAVYYATTGQMSLGHAGRLTPAAAAGVFLMLTAALFKIGAFPFHFWLPDAYEAAPPELAGFMSTSIKAGGFLLLARVLTLAGGGNAQGLLQALPWIAGLSMTVGNLLALRQKNLQRLLAYSSIAHAAYMLAAAWAAERGAGAGLGTVYLYLLAYLFMSTGSFVALKLAGISEIEDLRGLGSRSPGLTAFIALMLLSLAGIPGTAGFMAKLFVFVDLAAARGWWLAGCMALNSVLAMGYYFGLLRTMVFENGDQPAKGTEARYGIAAQLTLMACVAGTVAIGLWPWMRDWLSLVLAKGAL